MAGKITERVLEKVRHGDALDDDELRKALRFYREMEEGLSALGPHFHLAWKEVYRTLQLLEDFAQARKDRR
jgi:hypothetical protein